MSHLSIALEYIARGWHVFPCRPRTKEPAVQGGFKAATLDEAKVREWWARWPEANPAIATGASGLCVLDIDHGTESLDDAREWLKGRGIPLTYAVRTGRRPEYGLQLYYAGEGLKSIAWSDASARSNEGPGVVSGDIRCATGYVMAAGSIHPSGEAYEVALRGSVEPVPEFVRNLKAERGAGIPDDGEPITTARNNALTSIAGKLRNAGLSAEALEVALIQVNADRCQPPLSEGEVRRIAANASAWSMPEVEPEVTLGKSLPIEKSEPVDWRTLFHSREETENTPDPEFLIEGFLQVESITGIIGPARARKSIVVVNIIRALLTGEPLFGHFGVTNRPERVVYLCPESGLKSLAKRIRSMGLAEYVGDTLFYTSMNSEPMELMDPGLRAAAHGAVVFIDTAIRFFKGNENESQDMKVLGEHCQGLVRDGAAAVVLLHHTSKNTETVTLESGRGSGDFGGFLTCCWGTTLEDYEDAYKSLSHMSCVKQRDFQADRFNLAPSGDQNDFSLRYVQGSENAILPPKTRFKGNKDGQDETATAMLKAHPKMSLRELVELLEGHGIKRGKDWIQKRRRGNGVELKDIG